MNQYKQFQEDELYDTKYKAPSFFEKFYYFNTGHEEQKSLRKPKAKKMAKDSSSSSSDEGEYTNYTTIRHHFSYLVKTYVNTLRDVVNFANDEHQIYLQPEEFYLDRLGYLCKDWMLPSVLNIYQFQNREHLTKEMTVDQFVKHGLLMNAADFKKMRGRDMTMEEERQAIQTKKLVRSLELVKKVFTTIAQNDYKSQKIKDKQRGIHSWFRGSEAYIIWRMDELIKDPEDCDRQVKERNYQRFGRSDKSKALHLPTDKTLVSGVNNQMQDNIKEVY